MNSLFEPVRSAVRTADRPAWDEYIQLELDGIRREAVPALEKFVSRLQTYPAKEQEEFVRTLMAVVRKQKDFQLPIRHPLFDQVVLPVLLDDFDSDEPGSARILLDFYHQIHGGGLCKQIIGERDLSQWTLLDRALDQEPAAHDLQIRWLDLSQNWFEYAVHEVPAGVLDGHNGATMDECEELLAHLNQFETRAHHLRMLEKYREDVEEWRYYFTGYRDYLRRRSKFRNFEHFLNENPQTDENV